MKNVVRTGLFALCVGVLATGCFGCGDGDKGKPSTEKIDTGKTGDDPTKKVKDTTKAAIDTVKKDTSKTK
jgi:hypothetical protein